MGKQSNSKKQETSPFQKSATKTPSRLSKQKTDLKGKSPSPVRSSTVKSATSKKEIGESESKPNESLVAKSPEQVVDKIPEEDSDKKPEEVVTKTAEEAALADEN